MGGAIGPSCAGVTLVVVILPRPASARRVRREWDALSSLRTSADVFDRTRTANLPRPVSKWLQHSIRDGTPLSRTAWLRMRGHIRIGPWRPFAATQVLAPGIGFIWAATAEVAGIPVLGYDKYVDGIGDIRWRIGGLVPLMSAQDTNISTSAAGRLAAESVFVPTAFAGADWTSDDAGVHATWRIDDHRETVDLDVDANGRLAGLH